MAKWSKQKVSADDINNGNEYEQKDRVSLQQLNAMVNSGLYSQNFAEHLADTPDTSEVSNVGVPQVELVDNIVNGTTYKKFKFSNLKGDKGDRGERGEKGEDGKIEGACIHIIDLISTDTYRIRTMIINNSSAPIDSYSSFRDSLNQVLLKSDYSSILTNLYYPATGVFKMPNIDVTIFGIGVKDGAVSNYLVISTKSGTSTLNVNTNVTFTSPSNVYDFVIAL